MSHAILTTDVGPKVAQAGFTWNGRRGRLVGVAKGAGMIHPNMATMLAFLLTDVPAIPAFLKCALLDASNESGTDTLVCVPRRRAAAYLLAMAMDVS